MIIRRRYFRKSPLLAPLFAGLTAALVATMPAARGETPASEDKAPAPKVFTAFKGALEHAQARKLNIFIACMKTGDADSEKLAAILDDTGLYLNGEKSVLFRYRVDDDARGDSFRAHFGIVEPGYPIVILTGPDGKPLAHSTGLLEEYDYYSFVEEHAGYSALVLPSRVRLKRGIAATLKDAASGKDGKYHTPMRTWTLVTGEKIEAAVLHSTGAQVTFETKAGDLREVAALELSKPDFDFLKKSLESQTKFP